MVSSVLRAVDAVEHLDRAFELPSGFHIYRAAGPELSGGSYALTFDGEGRLLVGDGNAVRRLIDRDGDGRFDSFEIIATGLGWRGPQGLLVYDYRLYAVGGDGIQVFEGYRSGGELVRKGRIGREFNTGGDHDAHTIFRGHDDWLYFMAGNGAGIEDRKHITEETSPVLFEREASVFRISPDGAKWECLSAGGRNPPNLGMNYLGELFSFDSDMEWHVGLPWYRPVRLNHWAIGGDQGWQEVGAYPPYSLDCLAGVLEVGRGSPTWGVFYEHNQLPEKYRDAYLVCDYRWKKESNDQYGTTGRLVVFFLKRDGANWKASMEALARPKPGARDNDGKPINFALVDIAVAPDGSLFLTDHNQGIWRVYYRAPADEQSLAHQPPTIVPPWPPLPTEIGRLTEVALALPQPGSERSRLRGEEIRGAMGGTFWRAIRHAALDSKLPLDRRLRAIRLLAPRFSALPREFLRAAAVDHAPEIRGQAAWLMGIRTRQDDLPRLFGLLNDKDAFVRRRAAEALTRVRSPDAVPFLLERLGDSNRLIRYVAMIALTHYRTAEWFESASSRLAPQARMRALTASWIRREPPADETVRRAVKSLLADAGGSGSESGQSAHEPDANITRLDARARQARVFSSEDQLDLLRVLALFQGTIENDDELQQQVAKHLLRTFPENERQMRWEQIRLLGDYRVAKCFPKLLALLESERDEITQFHIARALAQIFSGWTSDEEERLIRWMLSTQRGWFAQFDAKGVEFPMFLQTTLVDLGKHHRTLLLDHLAKVDLNSLLGSVVIELIAGSPNSEERLLGLYRRDDRVDAKVKIIASLKNARTRGVSAFLRQEFQRSSQAKLRGAILQSLAAQPVESANLPLLLEGLCHDETDVVRACAGAIIPLKPDLDEPLANVLVSRLAERRALFHPMEKVLVTLSGQVRPGFKPEFEPGERLDETMRSTSIDFWRKWYEQRFEKPFAPRAVAVAVEKSDEEIHRFILSEASRGGRSVRGARVYETLQCNACHGGGASPGKEGRIFGPDLSGVTRRLSRGELADGLVYPSRQVAERFKAFEIELNDAPPVIGFITAQTEEALSLADREQVQRIARSRIRSIIPQSNSLMPEHLLNRLDWDEIRDLLAYLDEGLGQASGAGQTGK
jgi:putative heme-binding domain-containing protein